MNRQSFPMLLAVLALVPLAQGEDLSSKPAPIAHVLDFGLYELAGDARIIADPNTADGKRIKGGELHLIKQTDRVPATLGTSFGFRYTITGVAEPDSVELQGVVTHPPIQNAKGEVQLQYSYTMTAKVKNGEISGRDGYRLHRPEELVPGKWTFEITYHGQKLISQSFSVYSPDTQQSQEPKK